MRKILPFAAEKVRIRYSRFQDNLIYHFVMRKRKPINYEIKVTGEPVIARLPKEQADSLVFSLELIIYDMLHDEQKKALSEDKRSRE